MSDIRSLEHPTLKVPYENLNKRFRGAQKTFERESNHVSNAAVDLEAVLKTGEDAKALENGLQTLLERANALASKTREAVALEKAAAANCELRLTHLRNGLDVPANANDASSPSANRWKQTRLDRMLVEHFLRSGFYDAAGKLARDADIVELTNINVFLVAKEVEEALQNKDTAKCLTWCHDNKSKLRKLKSSLEFDVRLQEFVELVKSKRTHDAVKHARRYLANAGVETTDQLPQVQRALALLAFPNGTRIAPYSELLAENRWQKLVEQFRHENFRLFQLSTQSVFSVALQAGLSALKTQRCSTGINANNSVANDSKLISERNAECPVCQPPLSELSSPLPFAHCSQSRLICFLSGKPLNENNQPMMLPNGFVYGERALTKMAAENDGQIVCPRTKEIFAFSDAEKVFVM